MHKLHSMASRLSDADLLRRVVVLAGHEREATIELVSHLAELDARRLHVAEGYGSLFAYCTGALRLAEHAAYNRIEAARLSRRFPAILDLLTDGSLNLSTARLLAPHLQPENFDSVVAQARGRSKREVETLVARLAPKPDLVSSVRKLPAPAQMAVESEAGAAVAALAEPEHPTPRPVVAPLAPGRYQVHFTVDAATHEKLRRAQDLLRREVPDGNLGVIVGRALTLLLDDVARRKLAATAKPRSSQGARSRSRHIPAHVKRAVWVRDGGRCAFVTARGRRCSERVLLEFHHREPYAIGGEATVANISLRCKAHNLYEAELAFGPIVARPHPAARMNSPRGELGPGRFT